MNQISFGITTYNGSALLDKCLLSLINSIQHAKSLLDYQIIIYDDGSSDEKIQEVAGKYHAIWIKESINKGLVHGYNVISKLARHNIICLLDNDVIVPVDFVKALLRSRNIYKKHGVLGFISEKISRHDFLNLVPVLSKYSDMTEIEPTTELAGYCYCFHKKDWEAVGGFDENFRMFLADSDFCCRLANNFKKISLRFNWPIVYHIEHETLYSHEELKWKEQLRKDSDYFENKWGNGPAKMDRLLTWRRN